MSKHQTRLVHGVQKEDIKTVKEIYHQFLKEYPDYSGHNTRLTFGAHAPKTLTTAIYKSGDVYASKTTLEDDDLIVLTVSIYVHLRDEPKISIEIDKELNNE